MSETVESEVVQQSSTATKYAEYLHPKNILKIPGAYGFLAGTAGGFILGFIWGFIKSIPGIGHALGLIFKIQDFMCDVPVIKEICQFVVALRIIFFLCLVMISFVLYYITGSSLVFNKVGGLMGLWFGFYLGSTIIGAIYGDKTDLLKNKKREIYLQ